MSDIAACESDRVVSGAASLDGWAQVVDDLQRWTDRLVAREAATARRRDEAEAEAAQIIDRATASAANIIRAAHQSAAEIIEEARGLGDAEEKRHIGKLIERQSTIAALDTEIAARRNTLAEIDAQAAELRGRLG